MVIYINSMRVKEKLENKKSYLLRVQYVIFFFVRYSIQDMTYIVMVLPTELPG